jgi:hypothetical protein
MRMSIMATVAAALFVSGTPAGAQWSKRDIEYRRDQRQTEKQYRSDMHAARKDHRRETRGRNADWREANRYDWNRPDPRYGGTYRPERYYRDARYYADNRYLGHDDRVYRGGNGRYYCRREDGTTGLIVDAIGGGVLGNLIAPGGSETIGTLLGAGLGATFGNAVARNEIRCR